MQQSNDTQLCVRLKRQKTTYFFICTQFDGIDTIKRKLIQFHKGLDLNDIRLYLGNRLLDDKSNIHDQDVSNDSLIYFKLKKGNTNQWEEIPELGV